MNKKEEVRPLEINDDANAKNQTDFIMIFASCNKQDMDQPLWEPIIANHPDVFIWGGDNIYADTSDMNKMKADYKLLNATEGYSVLKTKTTIIGTWDDHDYGKNDAGKEWDMKDQAQDLFLDFLQVSESDVRRQKEGVYYSETFTTSKGSIKVILLDTRYFRDQLKKSHVEGKNYEPWGINEGGTILGRDQWAWFQEELKDDSSDFTIIVSSIQFLAHEHDWEKWGNHPGEVVKMYRFLKEARANNIFFLSGDRHLAEFSKNEVEGLSYPLIDFTSSGLTNTYPDSPYEPNIYRVGTQVRQINFGVLKFDFDRKKVTMEIRGINNKLYQALSQKY